jgi:uncharacterized membrane protein
MRVIGRKSAMKYTDIEKIREAGLITAEQQQRINEHFALKEDDSKLLTVLSVIGAVLAVCGVALLIAANWQEIPRGVKIAAGILLMLGAHAGGWHLRENKDYPKTGEALHLIGSGLFLANIALIGQVYHISSRPPNAFLLWWAGIAALPWILRSKAQHVLSLLAFSFWFGMEINESGSPIFFGNDEAQLIVYSFLGLIYLGLGYCLRRTAFAEFASATEKLGLLAFLSCAYPLTWGDVYRHPADGLLACSWLMPVLGAVSIVALAFGLAKHSGLAPRWRWTWGLSPLAMIGLIAGAAYLPIHPYSYEEHRQIGYHSLCAVALFVFCLLQIQTGILERSPYMVNLGVAFVALDIIATYITLFGSMGQTGLVFLVGGVFLIGFGIYLEKKRRALLKQIKSKPA